MKLKVGVVIDPWDYPYNGTVVSTRRFVSALSNDFDFRLLTTPDPAGTIDDRVYPFPKISIPGFNKIIDAMKVPLANPWGRANVRESLKGLDLVHMQFPFFLGSAVCRVAKKLNMPLICSFHVQPENLLHNLGVQSDRLSRWLYRLFIWGMYQHADLVLAPSAFAAQQLKRHGLTTPIEVLSNGVPEVFFASGGKNNPPPRDNKFQLLSVGRMAPEKHHDMMIQALAKTKNRDNIQLRLIGTGPLEDQLREQVDALGLDAEIGRVDDAALLEHYRAADLFVHAGEIELEGMSVLEAMACATTVLVSDSANSAAGELAVGENTLFNCQSIEDLANKIDYWVEHPEQRYAQGEFNREQAMHRHHEKSVQQLTTIYRRVFRASTGSRENE